MTLFGACASYTVLGLASTHFWRLTVGLDIKYIAQLFNSNPMYAATRMKFRPKNGKFGIFGKIKPISLFEFPQEITCRKDTKLPNFALTQENIVVCCKTQIMTGNPGCNSYLCDVRWHSSNIRH